MATSHTLTGCEISQFIDLIKTKQWIFAVAEAYDNRGAKGVIKTLHNIEMRFLEGINTIEQLNIFLTERGIENITKIDTLINGELV